MSDHGPDSDLGALWRSDPPPPSTFSIADVKARSAKFQRQIEMRNMREYVAGAASVIFFTVFGLRAPHGAWIYRAGCLLIIVGLAVVLIRLRRLGTPGPAVPPDAPATEHLRALRDELVRQRALARSAFGGYVAPLVPGVVLLLLGSTFDPMPHRFADRRLLTLAITSAFGFAIMLGVVLANRWAARKLDAEIAALRDVDPAGGA